MHSVPTAKLDPNLTPVTDLDVHVPVCTMSILIRDCSEALRSCIACTAIEKAVHSAQSAGLRYPAAVHVEHARELLGSELAALVGESYERAYPDMVRVQQLTELEEVIDYSQAEAITNGEPDSTKHSSTEHRLEPCLSDQRWSHGTSLGRGLRNTECGDIGYSAQQGMQQLTGLEA